MFQRIDHEVEQDTSQSCCTADAPIPAGGGETQDRASFLRNGLHEIPDSSEEISERENDDIRLIVRLGTSQCLRIVDQESHRARGTVQQSQMAIHIGGQGPGGTPTEALYDQLLRAKWRAQIMGEFRQAIEGQPFSGGCRSIHITLYLPEGGADQMRDTLLRNILRLIRSIGDCGLAGCIMGFHAITLVDPRAHHV